MRHRVKVRLALTLLALAALSVNYFVGNRVFPEYHVAISGLIGFILFIIILLDLTLQSVRRRVASRRARTLPGEQPRANIR